MTLSKRVQGIWGEAGMVGRLSFGFSRIRMIGLVSVWFQALGEGWRRQHA